MRKVLSGAIAAIFVLGLASPILCAELKIGYIDTVKVVSEYQKYKDNQKILQDKQKKKEEEGEVKIAELKKLQDQYVLLSDAEKEKKKGDIEKKAQEIDEFARQARMDLMQQERDYMAEIVDEIDKIVKKQAKDEGYDYVLSGQAIIFGKEGFDLTSSVLKELNDSYSKKK